MTEQNDQPKGNLDAQKSALDKRLDALGWGLFLIMIGCLWLIPDEYVPGGIWLIGTGMIILGLMGVRYMYGVKISGFWLVLGILALVFGLSDLFGLNLPLLPILIIIIGISIIVKHLHKKK